MEVIRHTPSAATPFSQLSDDVWVLNRPSKIGPIDLGHRMTVVRLASGGLWIHSPVALDDEVRGGLDSLGEAEYLIAPSMFHDLYWPAWFAAYPRARFCAAHGVCEEHPELPFTDVLGANTPAPWSTDLGQALLGGMPKVNETVFLHPASKTLIAADMAFNHDGNVDFATGLVLRLAGCHSGFNVSRFYKLFIGDRKSMRHSVDEVLDWDFERIVLGHGHIVQKDGRQILEDAYAFLRP